MLAVCIKNKSLVWAEIYFVSVIIQFTSIQDVCAMFAPSNICAPSSLIIGTSYALLRRATEHSTNFLNAV